MAKIFIGMVLVLAQMSAFAMADSLQNASRLSTMIISIKNPYSIYLNYPIRRESLSKKKLKLFYAFDLPINDLNQNALDSAFNDKKVAVATSLYEFKLTSNKPDSIIFYLFPFFNSQTPEDKSQSVKKPTITLFQINFF